MRLRKVDWDLEGNTNQIQDFAYVTTSSLSQGLNSSCGMTYSMIYLEKDTNRVFVLMRELKIKINMKQIRKLKAN